MSEADVIQIPEHGICAICRKKPVVHWCDYIINYDDTVIFVRNEKLFKQYNESPRYTTCDLPMCNECSSTISRGLHFCKHHMSLYKQVKLPTDFQRKRQAHEQVKIMRLRSELDE